MSAEHYLHRQQEAPSQDATRVLQLADSESVMVQTHPSLPNARIHSIFRDESMRLDEREIFSVLGTASDIDVGDPRQLREAQYDPGDYLVGRVLHAFQSAEEKNCCVCLKCDHGSLTLFPGDRKILVWMQEEDLRSLAASPMDDASISVSELELGPNSRLDPRDRQHSLDAFLWRQALRASRGRMPLGTDPFAPVILSRGPNLVRHQIFPRALQIAALWDRPAYSLFDTAKMLDIPQRYVFAFYSAAHAVGLAATKPRTGTPTTWF